MQRRSCSPRGSDWEENLLRKESKWRGKCVFGEVFLGSSGKWFPSGFGFIGVERSRAIELRKYPSLVQEMTLRVLCKFEELHLTGTTMPGG